MKEICDTKIMSNHKYNKNIRVIENEQEIEDHTPEINNFIKDKSPK